MISYDPKNWLRVLFDFPRSPVFRTLFLDVLGAGAWAALVVWVETDLVRVAVPLGPSFLSILGIILGLLLVFRTNTAYDRWWEGRRLWGQLVNVSRGLAQQLGAGLRPPGAPATVPDAAPQDATASDATASDATASGTPAADDPLAPRRARYAALIGEFPAALATHLRRPPGSEGPHRPNALIRALHAEVQADLAGGRLTPEHRIALAPLLQAFDDVTGACERIRNTPIPFSYSSYIKQFVVLYAFIMPFGLVREFGYGTVVACMFTFFATMGLELLATEIEEPFGTDINDLPLETIAGVIKRDTGVILG